MRTDIQVKITLRVTPREFFDRAEMLRRFTEVWEREAGGYRSVDGGTTSKLAAALEDASWVPVGPPLTATQSESASASSEPTPKTSRRRVKSVQKAAELLSFDVHVGRKSAGGKVQTILKILEKMGRGTALEMIAFAREHGFSDVASMRPSSFAALSGYYGYLLRQHVQPPFHLRYSPEEIGKERGKIRKTQEWIWGSEQGETERVEA